MTSPIHRPSRDRPRPGEALSRLEAADEAVRFRASALHRRGRPAVDAAWPLLWLAAALYHPWKRQEARLSSAACRPRPRRAERRSRLRPYPERPRPIDGRSGEPARSLSYLEEAVPSSRPRRSPPSTFPLPATPTASSDLKLRSASPTRHRPIPAMRAAIGSVLGTSSRWSTSRWLGRRPASTPVWRTSLSRAATSGRLPTPGDAGPTSWLPSSFGHSLAERRWPCRYAGNRKTGSARPTLARAARHGRRGARVGDAGAGSPAHACTGARSAAGRPRRLRTCWPRGEVRGGLRAVPGKPSPGPTELRLGRLT